MLENVKFEDGEWWYTGNGDGNRRRLASHSRKNTTRMFVNGKYIPKSHPMHKPGNYRTFEDAWSHQELNKQKAGYVYAICNPAWPGWIKVGMAVDAADRLNSYQTGSPMRDFELIASFKTEDKSRDEKKAHIIFRERCSEQSGEWFKISKEDAYSVIADLALLPDPLQTQQQLPFDERPLISVGLDQSLGSIS